jgi:hypothetical protein
VNGINAVGCLPVGEVLTAGQTAIGTVLAGVTSSTPIATSATLSTTGECHSCLIYSFVRLITIPEVVPTSATPTPTPTPTGSNSSGGGGLNAVQIAFSILGPIVGIASLIFAIFAYKRNKDRKDPGSAVNSSSAGGSAPWTQTRHGNVFELGQNSRRPPGFDYEPVHAYQH